MNGAHDMGGDHGHGPVDPEIDEPIFHAEWERRALGLTLAAGSNGRWNLDRSRFTRENVAQRRYLARSYYEMWIEALETLTVETGMATADELATARAGGTSTVASVTTPPLKPERVETAMRRGGSTRVELDDPPPASFEVGQVVRARRNAPTSHTRLPRYARGRVGTVVIDHGVFIFPDTHAATGDPKPQHLYAVRFTAEELWGPSSTAANIHVDLWDDYLEATETS